VGFSSTSPDGQSFLCAESFLCYDFTDPSSASREREGLDEIGCAHLEQVRRLIYVGFACIDQAFRYSQLVARIFPAKPEGFVPKPALYLLLLISSFATTFLIPYASNTPSFMTISVLSRALPFSFLVLPSIIPESWGTVHSHPHGTHPTYTTLFRTISTLSLLLHFKSSFLALFNNTPESTYYRHSLLHPFKEEHRSALNRSSTAFGRVFGAILEHPAISAVGSDVLLSGLSLGVWAAIRGLDPKEMLGSSVPFMERTQEELEDISTNMKAETEKAVQQ
jgi:hypothetical protein